jgi:hypothetical protein
MNPASPPRRPRPCSPIPPTSCRDSTPSHARSRTSSASTRRLLAFFIPNKTPFDPDDPQSFDEALPEPAAWLDRLIREPFMLAKRRLKQIHWPRKRQLATSRR